MTRIDTKLGAEPIVSFEFGPPRTVEAELAFWSAIEELAALEPAFVSVTCGAGGSTRDLTLAVVRRLARERGLEAVPHVTATGFTRDELEELLAEAAAGGADNVLALRGDPPRGEAKWTAPEGGVQSSLELTALAAEAGFCVLGAAYPEPHPDSRGWAEDLAHLRAKVDAGVRVLVTQLFFDNDDYRRFVDRLRAGGIDVPVLPGIIPITTISMIERVASLCGATHPGGAAARARRAPGRPARGGRAGRGLRDRAGRRAARRRRAGRASVHAEQVTGDARDRQRTARGGRVARGVRRRRRARTEVVGRDQVQRERVARGRWPAPPCSRPRSVRSPRRSSCGTRPAGGPARACRRGCGGPSATCCSPSSGARRAARRSPWPRSAGAGGMWTRSAGTWSSRPRPEAIRRVGRNRRGTLAAPRPRLEVPGGVAAVADRGQQTVAQRARAERAMAGTLRRSVVALRRWPKADPSYEPFHPWMSCTPRRTDAVARS